MKRFPLWVALACLAACGGSALFGSGAGSDGAGGADGGQGGGALFATSSSADSNSNSSAATGGASASSSTSSGTGPMCAHSICEVGDALAPGCDSCVDTVCAEDDYCCDDGWDDQCIQLADRMCAAGCCGNGMCEGQTCDTCPDDCGECICDDGVCEGEDCGSCEEDCGPCPTCGHSVCETGDALSVDECRDPCVDEVCAQEPSCCGMGNMVAWDVACLQLAVQLCDEDPCVAEVCKEHASCCDNSWDAGCVAEAEALCATGCDCEHPVCETGDALEADCDPCAAAICESDGYCCDQGWDGICRDEVATICGIVCPS